MPSEDVRGNGASPTRRAVLGGLAAGPWILAGCRSGGARASRGGGGWDELADRLSGELLVRGDRDYEARRTGVQWNGRKTARRPEAIARVADASDVAACVRYARDHRLRVAVRGAGHSWCASSVRDGGLLIDVDRLRDVEVDVHARTARCGPAASGADLIDAAHPHGLAFPVGHCRGVPLSGFLLSGGFGWNAGAWGPACASVIAIDVVDARGEAVRADASTNADLFWAARGAGPGFPGVVTRYHLRLFDAPRAVVTRALAFALSDGDAVADRVDAVRAAVPPQAEVNCVVSPAAPPTGPDGSRGERAVVVVATAFASSEREADEWLGRIDAAIAGTAGDGPRPVRDGRDATDFPGVLGSLAPFFPEGRRYAADVLWSGAPVADVMRALAASTRAAPSPDSFALCVPIPPLPEGAPPPPDMAFSLVRPVFAGVYGCWSEASEDAANAAWLRGVQRDVAGLSDGHYVGESDLTASDDRARRSFTPEAWRRLADVRRRWDPEGRFFSFLGARDRA